MNKKIAEWFEELKNSLISSGVPADTIVPPCGRGDEKVVLVGEAPGKDEVKLKRPFVGKAGKILDEFLACTGLSRDEIYITNTVKFRPVRISPKGTVSNRPPTRDEVSMCSGCLFSELSIVSPVLVVTLGNTPLRALTKDPSATVGNLHGKMTETGGFRLFPLYHPASTIYNRSLTETCENDMKELASLIKRLVSGVDAAAPR